MHARSAAYHFGGAPVAEKSFAGERATSTLTMTRSTPTCAPLSHPAGSCCASVPTTRAGYFRDPTTTDAGDVAAATTCAAVTILFACATKPDPRLCVSSPTMATYGDTRPIAPRSLSREQVGAQDQSRMLKTSWLSNVKGERRRLGPSLGKLTAAASSTSCPSQTTAKRVHIVLHSQSVAVRVFPTVLPRTEIEQ